eukprot:9741261-Ditylum_brightwellii.AAC.1
MLQKENGTTAFITKAMSVLFQLLGAVGDLTSKALLLVKTCWLHSLHGWSQNVLNLKSDDAVISSGLWPMA